MTAVSHWLACLLFYLAHIVVAPLLLAGFVRKGKAILQGRRGPSVLQPFWDTFKLLRKGETISSTATRAFQWAPLVCLAAAISAAFMAPWLGLPAPISGDLLLFIYVLALGKFAMGLAALDTGSSFGAFAASREAAVSVQTEPAMVTGLAALAVHAHSSSLGVLLSPGHPGMHIMVLAPLVVFALWLSAMAELSRMPVDDPTTHLELTMIHEALILENSGPGLALMEYAAALKTLILLGLVARVLLLIGPPLGPLVTYVCTMALVMAGAAVLVLAESVLVKLRWRRIPNLLSFAVAAGALACLLVAVRG